MLQDVVYRLHWRIPTRLAKHTVTLRERRPCKRASKSRRTCLTMPTDWSRGAAVQRADIPPPNSDPPNFHPVASSGKLIFIFSARQHIYAKARYMLSPVRLSVCLSVTRVDQSKTVAFRIMQPSPQTQSSPMTLVFWRLTSPRNSKGNIGSGCIE